MLVQTMHPSNELYGLGASAKDTGWLRKKDLTDAIDRYMASHPRNDRPKAFAVGQTPQAMSKQNSGGFDQAKAASSKAMPPKFNVSSQSNKNKGAFPPPGENAGNVRYCFHGGKPGHVMKSCVFMATEAICKTGEC